MLAMAMDADYTAVGTLVSKAYRCQAAALWLLAAAKWHWSTSTLLLSSVSLPTRIVRIVIPFCPACCLMEGAGVVD